MSPKLDLFNLSDVGVVLNPSDIHRLPGALTTAKNAIVEAGEEGALTKRGGMARVNSSAAAGSISGIINVPLANKDSLTSYLYAAPNVEDTDWGSNTWIQTSNGTTYTNVTTPVAAARRNLDSAVNYFLHQPVATLNNVIYYAANGYTLGTDEPRLRAWNGTDDTLVFEVPDHPSNPGVRSQFITKVLAANGRIYVATVDSVVTAAGPNHMGRVFEYVPETGEVLQVGNAFGNATGEATGGYPNTLIWWLGRLWGCTNPAGNAGDGREGTVVWIRPGLDTTWTTDVTLPSDQVGISMAVYNGNLYVGCYANASPGAGTALIRKRTPGGTWSTSNSGGTNKDGQFQSLTTFGTSLYAVQYHVQTPTTETIVTFDDSSWSNDFDVPANVSDATNRLPGMLLTYGSNLYYHHTNLTTGTGHIVRRVSGVWSVVYTSTDLLKGLLATISF